MSSMRSMEMTRTWVCRMSGLRTTTGSEVKIRSRQAGVELLGGMGEKSQRRPPCSSSKYGVPGRLQQGDHGPWPSVKKTCPFGGAAGTTAVRREVLGTGGTKKVLCPYNGYQVTLREPSRVV